MARIRYAPHIRTRVLNARRAEFVGGALALLSADGEALVTFALDATAGVVDGDEWTLGVLFDLAPGLLSGTVASALLYDALGRPGTEPLSVGLITDSPAPAVVLDDLRVTAGAPVRFDTAIITGEGHAASASPPARAAPEFRADGTVVVGGTGVPVLLVQPDTGARREMRLSDGMQAYALAVEAGFIAYGDPLALEFAGPFSATRSLPAPPSPISMLTPFSMADLTDEMIPENAFRPGTFTSQGASIPADGIEVTFLVNGQPSEPSPDLRVGDTVTPVVAVTDSLGRRRTFVGDPVPVILTPPTFDAQPKFGATAYLVGDVLTWSLGTPNKAATLTVEDFTLNGLDRETELAGPSATSWTSTGEMAGSVTLRTRATNAAGFKLSDPVTVPLQAADQVAPEVAALAYDDPTNVLAADTDEGGTAYYLVGTSTAPMDGPALRTAVEDGGGLERGTFPLASQAEATVPLSSLASGIYAMHVAVEDPSGNISAPQVIEFEWVAADAPAGTWSLASNGVAVVIESSPAFPAVPAVPTVALVGSAITITA